MTSEWLVKLIPGQSKTSRFVIRPNPLSFPSSQDLAQEWLLMQKICPWGHLVSVPDSPVSSLQFKAQRPVAKHNFWPSGQVFSESRFSVWTLSHFSEQDSVSRQYICPKGHRVSSRLFLLLSQSKAHSPVSEQNCSPSWHDLSASRLDFPPSSVSCSAQSWEQDFVERQYVSPGRQEIRLPVVGVWLQSWEHNPVPRQKCCPSGQGWSGSETWIMISDSSSS